MPSLLDSCLAFYAKNVRLLQSQMKSIPPELIHKIYNYMIGNNLLEPKDLHLFKNSIHQMTIDGSVENGEDFLASYCSVQRSFGSDAFPADSALTPTSYHKNWLHSHNPYNDCTPEHTPEPDNSDSDESNSYFDINSNGNNITCNNNYFYGENDFHLQVLFGKSIRTSLFYLKEANMVTDLTLDDFEDDQVLKKLPGNLKHLSVRWCKLSGTESLAFLNGMLSYFIEYIQSVKNDLI